jgi:peptidyl-prolyl cis-trans isomerase A (cyclophilin A)
MMIHRRIVGLALLVLTAAIFFSGCSAKPAPAQFSVLFETSKGDVTIDVTRDWSPRGADRFYELVKAGFYDGSRFFRVIRSPEPFMAQFGINGDPGVTAKWANANIDDDPVVQHNTRGMISFATSGPNTRSTQLFINYGDNSRHDPSGFSPFGVVSKGMEVVDQFYAEYGEGEPRGAGPDQGRIETEGNAYLNKDFPKLDYIKTAKIVEAK